MPFQLTTGLGTSKDPILASCHSYVNLHPYLCNFNTELWQVYSTTLHLFPTVWAHVHLLDGTLLGHRPIIMAHYD
jgi:hypothetical protein